MLMSGFAALKFMLNFLRHRFSQLWFKKNKKSLIASGADIYPATYLVLKIKQKVAYAGSQSRGRLADMIARLDGVSKIVKNKGE